MKGIQDFFDALSTAGGSVFVFLLLLVMFGIPLIVFAFHPNVDHDIKQLIITGFSGSVTGLALALKSNSSRQQMVDRGITPAVAAQIATSDTPKQA